MQQFSITFLQELEMVWPGSHLHMYDLTTS